MDKETMKKEKESLKGVIYRLNKKCKEIEQLIPQAEKVVELLKPLENSKDSRERMKFLSAQLELSTLKNDLANARVLITMKSNQLESLEKRIGEEKSGSEPGLGE